MTKEISNSDDIIDSRDVIERIEELEAELFEGTTDGEHILEEELTSLKKLAKQCLVLGCEARVDVLALAGAARRAKVWIHGELLIRDDYFEEYARELAEDIGAIQSDQGWPNYCIDWTFAAEELQNDYTLVDFDGVTYWIRS